MLVFVLEIIVREIGVKEGQNERRRRGMVQGSRMRRVLV